jgi:uncharacterized protein (TIGR04255 family)
VRYGGADHNGPVPKPFKDTYSNHGLLTRVMALSADIVRPIARAHARRIYSRPPIVEAILDISVQPADGVSAERLDHFFDLLCEIPENRLLEARNAARVTVDGKTGYSLRDPERGFSVRAFLDRLGFARSGQYSRWEDFRDEGKKVWGYYRDAASPVTVKRASLRYVNRLNLPKDPSVNLASYLNVVPKLAEGFAPMLSGFTFEVKMPQPDMQNTVVVVREAAVTASDPSEGSIVLDIEVIRGLNISSQAQNDFWKVLEDLHDRANHTFESAITDKVRELIA